MNQTIDRVSANVEAPLTNFSECHEGILSPLAALGELPALLEPAARARKLAEDTLLFFRGVVVDHHTEEEKDLFPAVLANANRGEERDQVQNLVDELRAEHRAIVGLWHGLEPQLEKIAKGQPADLDVASLPRAGCGAR